MKTTPAGRPFALVRQPSDRYADCLVRAAARPRIDLALARRQHEAYARRLAQAGYAVQVLPQDPALADCCFIEDTAVLLGGAALVTRPGAPSRLDEVEVVAAALARRLPVTRMAAPATLDGGDVLRSGGTLFVGRSERTNEAGIRCLAEFGLRHGHAVRAVPVGDGLHLKSRVVPLGAGAKVLLIEEDAALASWFADHELVVVPKDHANALPLAAGPERGLILIPAGLAATRAALLRRGFAVEEIDISEFRKGDGGLTCLSLLAEPGG